MSEQYQEFKANDYVKTEADIKELITEAMDEDLGDGTVIRAVLKHVAQTKNLSDLARDTADLTDLVGRPVRELLLD